MRMAALFPVLGLANPRDAGRRRGPGALLEWGPGKPHDVSGESTRPTVAAGRNSRKNPTPGHSWPICGPLHLLPARDRPRMGRCQVRNSPEVRITNSTMSGHVEVSDWSTIPTPSDDGADRHLPGLRVPSIPVRATDRTTVDLPALS